MNKVIPVTDENELRYLKQTIARNLKEGKGKEKNAKWLELKGWSKEAAADFIDRVEWQMGGVSSPSTGEEGPDTAAQTTAAPPPPTAENSVNGNTGAVVLDPKPLASFLILMLWMSLLAEVAFLFIDLKELSIIGLMEEGLAAATMSKAGLLRQGLIILASLLIFIITAVAFLKWVHRVTKNSKGLGARGTKLTPGWSVGYYFIPILNFYMPYLSMKEIWKVSINPENWRTQKVPRLINWWWGLWVFGGVLGQTAFRILRNPENLESLKTATQISVFTSLLGVPLCLVTMKLVKTITSGQQKHIKILGLEVFSKTARGKRAIARQYAWTMWFGLLWAAGGVIASLISYKAAGAKSGGGTYYVYYGAVIYGIYDFFRGLIGFMKNKR